MEEEAGQVRMQGRVNDQGEAEIYLLASHPMVSLSEQQALAIAQLIVLTVEKLRGLPNYQPSEQQETTLVVDYKAGCLIDLEALKNDT